jgi:NAD(P)-dependent dehydrogenase (short-subunit alcohol dehydrogenase family)
MKIRLKPLQEQVIVITGGSSGIGLATGIEAARRGARVVLAARHEEPLLAAWERLAAVGGDAITVIADVGRSADVQRIAATAVQYYGGFDTWVNNAGWSVFGALDSVDDEDHRSLFETNFWGTVNGSLEALAHLGRSGGSLINIGSVASEVALPLQGMYSASKHAVKGFTDALRVEAQHRALPISVTLIKPSGIATPFVEHARNFTGRNFQLPPPVYSPEEVANTILAAAETPIREITVGGGGRLLEMVRSLWPAASDWTARHYLIPQQLGDQPEQVNRSAQNGARVHGPHPGHVVQTSLYTRAKLHPAMTMAIATIAGLTGAMLWSRSRRTWP